MAAAQCFFCKRFAACDDHRADCTDYEAKPVKTARKRGRSLTVTFK